MPDAWNTEMGAAALRRFLGAHRAVWLWEGGERIAHLEGERAGFSLGVEAGRLICHFWSAEANLVRRVVGCAGDGDGERLRLRCWRLGQSHPTGLVLESAPQGEVAEAHVARAEFRQALVAAARRDWPGWSYVGTGGGSPRQAAGAQRLLFRRQQAAIACVAVADGDLASAGGALAQALAWTARVPRAASSYWAAVRLVLPPGAETLVAQRRRWLRADIPIECYRLDRSAGQLNRIELEPDGNWASELRRAPGRQPRFDAEAEALLAEMREVCPQMTLDPGPDGAGCRFRLYGLEVARRAEGAEAASSRFVFGYGREQSPLRPETRPLFHRFLRELGRQRVPGQDRRSPLYALQPERWMEHLLGHDLGSLDPACDPRFLYAQVPVCRAGGERDVLDLLAVDRAGRLLVVELKADESLDFPLQALDYWWRVRRHQQAGDFERLGYFPGVTLSPEPPRLWLVAPALRWHPHAERVLRWLAPEVPWTCLEINEAWRHGIQVICRKGTHDAGNQQA